MTTFAHNTAYRLTVGLLAVLAVVSLWVVFAHGYNEGPVQTHHEPVEQVHHEDVEQAHHEDVEQAHHEGPTQTHHEENS